MDADEIVAEIRRKINLDGTNPYRAAIEAGLPGTAIRQVLIGHRPRLGRILEIADALGLEFYIRPAGKPEEENSLTEFPAPFSRVRSRILAELMSALAKHWESLGTDYARDVWIDRLYRDYPELRAQSSERSSNTSAGE